MATVEEQAKLNELMSKGWSYRSYPEQSGEVISADYLTDVVTGKKHKIQVVNGKLSMTEVSE